MSSCCSSGYVGHCDVDLVMAKARYAQPVGCASQQEFEKIFSEASVADAIAEAVTRQLRQDWPSLLAQATDKAEPVNSELARHVETLCGKVEGICERLDELNAEVLACRKSSSIDHTVTQDRDSDEGDELVMQSAISGCSRSSTEPAGRRVSSSVSRRPTANAVAAGRSAPRRPSDTGSFILGTAQREQTQRKPTTTSQASHTSSSSKLVIGPKGTNRSQGVDPMSSLAMSSVGTMATEMYAVSTAGGQSKVLRRQKTTKFWDLWNDTEPPHATGISGMICNLVRSSKFDRVSLFVILLNTIAIIWQTDQAARNITMKLDDISLNLDIGFTTWYCLELGLKLYTYRLQFLLNGDKFWNMFDLVVVAICLMDLIATSYESVKPGYFRISRILKLTRTLRALRSVRYLYELRLLLNCVLTSLSSLLWACAFLGIVLLSSSLVFVQFATMHLVNLGENNATELDMWREGIEKPGLRVYFPSVIDGMMTLFKAVTGGEDWAYMHSVVAEMGWVSSALFVGFILFFLFVVTNICTSIFVGKAFRLAMPDLEAVLMEKRREDTRTINEFRMLFNGLDLNNDGTISLKEFRKMQDDPRMKKLFELEDLNINDCDTFFELVCAGSGVDELSIEAFVQGCMRLKGLASSIDVQIVAYQSQHLLATMREMDRRMALLSERMSRKQTRRRRDADAVQPQRSNLRDPNKHLTGESHGSRHPQFRDAQDSTYTSDDDQFHYGSNSSCNSEVHEERRKKAAAEIRIPSVVVEGDVEDSCRSDSFPVSPELGPQEPPHDHPVKFAL